MSTTRALMVTIALRCGQVTCRGRAPAILGAFNDAEELVLANWITLSRYPLLLGSVLTLYLGPPAVRLAGVAVLFVGLLLDTVDGVVARRAGQTSLFGSVLDIAADRTYEIVLWVCFADLRLIPTAIPLIVVARTTLTDALRSVGVGQGVAPFAQQHSVLARFLVGSSWMRTGYAAGKIVTFCGLALAPVLAGFPIGTMAQATAAPLLSALQAVAWLTVGTCVVRGLPVLLSPPLPSSARPARRPLPAP